jgi:C4-dicarboxylate transporter, DctM subunit
VIALPAVALDDEPSWGTKLLRVLNRVLNHLEEWLIATLIAAATLLIFVAVLHRYGAGLSIDIAKWAEARNLALLAVPARAAFVWLAALDLSWAQELCIYMFVWVAKFGAAYGVRTGIHVGVDVVVNQLKSPWRNAVVLFGLFCGAFFTAVIGTMGAKFVWGLMHTDQVSPDLEIPSWFVYLCIPLGSYLMCFRFLQVAYGYWRTGELPHHDHAHVEGVEIEEPGVGAAEVTR